MLVFVICKRNGLPVTQIDDDTSRYDRPVQEEQSDGAWTDGRHRAAVSARQLVRLSTRSNAIRDPGTRRAARRRRS